MKILRWLLSHTFLILLIVVVIYGYMFWGNLVGRDTPAGKVVAYLSSEFVEVEEFVNAVKAKQAQLRDEKLLAQKPASTKVIERSSLNKSAEIQQSPVVSKDTVKVETSVVAEKEQDVATQKKQVNEDIPLIKPAETTLKNSKSSATIDKKKETQPVNTIKEDALPATVSVSTDADVTDADINETFVSPEIERQLEKVNDQGKVLSESQRSEAVRANWILARKSFYQRKYDVSEKNYRKVIASTEDNFDAYGELGNVYFNQGKKQLAATAYFEAAAILVRKGQINRAQSMVGLLKLLNKDKAQELQQLINPNLS